MTGRINRSSGSTLVTGSERASELLDQVPEGLMNFGGAFAQAAASAPAQKPASAASGPGQLDGRAGASAEGEGELFDGLLDKQVPESLNIKNILGKPGPRYQSSRNFRHFSEAMKKSLLSTKKTGKPSDREATTKINNQL